MKLQYWKWGAEIATKRFTLYIDSTFHRPKYQIMYCAYWIYFAWFTLRIEKRDVNYDPLT